jgi:hypothetical protein
MDQHNSEDESAIRIIVDPYTSAWNSHDAKNDGMAGIFAGDADFHPAGPVAE